ncbi:hypothetical protein KP509_30G023500 [Ceratopteris richardii]|uniref:Uncharacterized protein n=1 Tax=Ceratopteris richardii TaxID=49495 RepID=A0A8T2R0H9_CERRI|nr:hypothetical protein KP509_30G023500 [Ceratopteris richardii]
MEPNLPHRLSLLMPEYDMDHPQFSLSYFASYLGIESQHMSNICDTTCCHLIILHKLRSLNQRLLICINPISFHSMSIEI